MPRRLTPWRLERLSEQDSVALMQLQTTARGGVLMTTGRQSFLWFTREGRAYVVTDGPALDRVGALRRPRALPADEPTGGDETHGERLRHLADELLASGTARPAD